MELLPYEKFSSLRLEQFLPPDAEINDFECDRQAWKCECHKQFAQTMFCFADSDPPTTLSGIRAQLGEGELPFEAADAILRALRLPVDTRATRDELIANFGAPEYCWRDDTTIPPKGRDKEHDFVRFLVGSNWPYRVAFTVRLDGGGLTNFWICRNDFWIEEKPFWEDDEDEGE